MVHIRASAAARLGPSYWQWWRTAALGLPRYLCLARAPSPVAAQGRLQRGAIHSIPCRESHSAACVPELASKPLEPAQQYTPADIEAVVLNDSTLQALQPAEIVALLEIESELAPWKGRPDLHRPRATVKRLAEHLLRLLTCSGGEVEDMTPDTLSRCAFWLFEYNPDWDPTEQHSGFRERLAEAIVQRARQLGLRNFSHVELGQLVVALGIYDRGEEWQQIAKAFYDEVRDECLRRGMQSFRARSLGQLVYGLGRARYEPGKELWQACVERAGKRGFLSRDCTPADVAFLLWGYRRAHVWPDRDLITSLTKRWAKPDFVEQLDTRDMVRVLIVLGDSRMRLVSPQLATELLQRLVQRAEAQGPQVLHLGTMGQLVASAGRLARTQKETAPAVAALFRTLLKDIKDSGPAVHLGISLAQLLLQAWDLDIEQMKDEKLVESLVQEIVAQGFDQWRGALLPFFMRRLSKECPRLPSGLVGALADEALQRPGMTLSLARPVLDALHYAEDDGAALHMKVQGMWEHLHRLHACTAQSQHVDAEVLVRLLRSLGTTAMADCVDASLLAKLVDDLLAKGLGQLSDKARMIALLALSQLSRKGGLREHREVEARLHDGMWAMWGQLAKHKQGAGKGLGPLFNDGPGRVHLAILLSALPLGAVRSEGSARGVVAVGDEVVRRDFLELLSAPDQRGLLIGLVHAHTHLPPPLGIDDKGAWALMRPLLAQIIRHQRAQCFVLPPSVRPTSKLRFFLSTVKSPAFQHALIDLYSTRVGLSQLDLVEVADLLELLTRGRRSAEHGLDTGFCSDIKEVLRRHDPTGLDVATSHRLRKALTDLPELLPSTNYLSELPSSPAHRGSENRSSTMEPLYAKPSEAKEKLLEDTNKYLLYISQSPQPLPRSTPRVTVVRKPRKRGD